jgi:putative peptidoglycan lipid II flippase
MVSVWNQGGTGVDEAGETPLPAVPDAISRRGLLGATVVIALGNVLSRGLGLVREQVIAATFGATGGTDAYVVARTVSVTLYDLLVGSIITAAFVPVFVQFARDERQLWRVVGAVFSLALLTLASIAALLALFPEPLAWALAGGFPAERRELSARLLRVALGSVVFQGLAGVLTGVLYAQHRFTYPAFGVAAYNTGVIGGVLLLSATLGVEALVVGLVLGGLGQFLLQAAGLRAFWRAYRPRIDLRDPAVRRVLALSGPVAAGMLVTVAGYALDINLASRLPEGSLSAKQYATTLIQFPLGMVGLAASVAILPTLSRFGRGADASARHYREALLFGVKLILLLMLPILAGLLVLAHPLVAVLFERGAFKAADTALTGRIVLAFAPQLPLTAIDYLLIAAFYARQDTRTPVLVGVASVAVYLAVALALIPSLGIVGLALADTAKNSAHGLILLALVGRAVPDLRLVQGLASFLARVVPIAGLMGGAVWLAWSAFSHAGDLPGLCVAIGLGVLAYGVMLQLLGVPEARAAVALIRAWAGRS